MRFKKKCNPSTIVRQLRQIHGLLKIFRVLHIFLTTRVTMVGLKFTLKGHTD